MKKHSKRKKTFGAPSPVVLDVAGLFNKMQQQLVMMERKIDSLIGKSLPGAAEQRPSPKPFQHPGQSYSHGNAPQNNNYRERVLYKAVCADCSKECEVPFRPSGERPVYCKECFSKRKVGHSFKGRHDSSSRPSVPAHTSQIARPQDGEKKKFSEKKKTGAKKRKTK